MVDAMQDARAAVLAFNGWHFADAESRVDALLAARDAEWRAAVERVRCEPVNRTAVHLAIVRAHNAALDALLAAMEAK